MHLPAYAELIYPAARKVHCLNVAPQPLGPWALTLVSTVASLTQVCYHVSPMLRYGTVRYGIGMDRH